jgi:hypothetical protein
MSAPQLRKTDEAVIHEIDRLLDHHTEREIATIFNQKRMAFWNWQAFPSRHYRASAARLSS